MENTHENNDFENDSLAAALASAYDHIESGGDAPDEHEIDTDDPLLADPLDAELDSTADVSDDKEAESSTAETENKADTEIDAEKASNDADHSDKEAESQETQTAHAPSSWTKAASQKWADLPDEIKAEIHKRESDYHNGIRQYQEGAQIAQGLQQAVMPYMKNIQASGVHPLQAINHLLGVEHVLRNGSPQEKAHKLSEIARDYGIELQSVQPLPDLDPQVQQLVQQNRQLQQFQQSVQMQTQQAVLSQIEQFKANPENSHYEEVKEDMAILLNSGRANNLQEAYEMAVWMRPDIRQTLVQKQSAEQLRQAEAQRRAKRAKTASGGVKGSANPKSTVLSNDASLRDTLLAAANGNL